MRAAGGKPDAPLARRAVRAWANCPAWIRSFGGRLQPPLKGTLHLDRTNVFFLGGGKALMNSYYAAAERMGITVRYGAQVEGLEIRDGGAHAISIPHDARPRPTNPK